MQILRRVFQIILYKIKKYIIVFLSFIGLGYVCWLVDTYVKLRYKFEALYLGTKSNRKSKYNLFNFRRNIHRLEKGLSYATLKDVFAEDYIYDTVYCLREGEKNSAFDEDSITWGKAVLKEYFSKVEHTEKVKKAYSVFQPLLSTNRFAENEIPYLESERAQSDISYSQLMNMALRRRSIRHFIDKEVSEDVIKKAYDIAKMSPSACNRQSFQYYFYNEKSIVKKLSQIPGGVAGYDIPTVIVIVGNYSGYFDERDINAPVIDASLAAMAFLFALETLGLGSVCINWPNLPDREAKIRNVLDLKASEFVIMMIGVGYPDPNGKIPFSKKRSADEVVKINKLIK
ncbi:nitroreductase family protein [Chondrinema litorale]|uniref:nitroreductase family protein n=1 Tax=Chondrinema litorale TaxID=2994555 RepID=UPI00254277F6|nr:nitroreductase family protein [Chondrinema litorale]UZR94363.1 nitroreductase family protein [Chondrinema litorale]